MMIWAAGGALAVLVVVVVVFARGGGPDHHASAPALARAASSGHTHLDVTPVARRETRPTLDPAGFSGQAARAYRVAGQIPEVLDQLDCYCACQQYGHVSLLSCYTDGHGAT